MSCILPSCSYLPICPRLTQLLLFLFTYHTLCCLHGTWPLKFCCSPSFKRDYFKKSDTLARKFRDGSAGHLVCGCSYSNMCLYFYKTTGDISSPLLSSMHHYSQSCVCAKFVLTRLNSGHGKVLVCRPWAENLCDFNHSFSLWHKKLVSCLTVRW